VTGIGDDALRSELEVIVAGYPERRAGALMCLHRVQQHRGCVGLQEQVLVAGVLGISPAHVRELVTFYTLFNEGRPGRHHLQLCRTLSCHIRGAVDLKRRIAERLGIGPGETLQVNEDYHEALTLEQLDELIAELAARPANTHPETA
jgi:NADH-quinone oxidoreductase subunit E